MLAVQICLGGLRQVPYETMFVLGAWKPEDSPLLGRNVPLRKVSTCTSVVASGSTIQKLFYYNLFKPYNTSIQTFKIQEREVAGNKGVYLWLKETKSLHSHFIDFNTFDLSSIIVTVQKLKPPTNKEL